MRASGLSGKQRRSNERALRRANERTAKMAEVATSMPSAPPASVSPTYDATDSAAQLMMDERINPAAVTGTGSDGRIIKADVEQFMRDNTP